MQKMYDECYKYFWNNKFLIFLIKIKPNMRNIEYYIESKLQIELIILFLKLF